MPNIGPQKKKKALMRIALDFELTEIDVCRLPCVLVNVSLPSGNTERGLNT